MASRNATGAGAAPAQSQMRETIAKGVCPACGEPPAETAIEQYGRFRLFECRACALHFWEPREMPDARWYEQMYGGRDKKLLPLEPGHKFFLQDDAAPSAGELLDIGCGTGNFLAAARKAGYRVSGIELDRNAARFAKERLGLERVFPLTISEFAVQQTQERFDVVTFFEVLEHQTTPAEFLQSVKACLRPRGFIALSVPNRERWLTAPDVVDYPPNHFLRWNAGALTKFLSSKGFEVLTIREEAAGVAHGAQMINMMLRTGITHAAEGEMSTSFRDVIQMSHEQAEAVLQTKLTVRRRVLGTLGRIKHAACFPLAMAAYPFIRMRGLKGTYLYCLARKCS